MTTRELTKLFAAIGADESSAVREMAANICKSEERKGHRSAARQLRSALNGVGYRSNGSNGQSPQPHNGHVVPVSSALVRLSTEVTLEDVVLNAASREQLRLVVREWQKRELLVERGLSPRSRLLFHGPPGCGKSLAARALAGELGIPAYLVRFDAVIGAYLGQTAIHLRQLFQFAETTPCVLLLDELDALGKRRGNPLDVGELDRIVIALMQELEHSHPAGIVVGTSNLPGHLDDALWRRFDLALTFPPPRAKGLHDFGRRVAKRYGVSYSRQLSLRVAQANSFAQAEAEVRTSAREQVLGSE